MQAREEQLLLQLSRPIDSSRTTCPLLSKKMERKLLVFLVVSSIWSVFLPFVLANPVEDKQALLDFLESISHSPRLNWNKDSSVCQSWTGVKCSADESRVIALRLPGAGLRGIIPPNTLSRLTAIQLLNLRMNRLSGSFPPDFSNFRNLTGLYLQRNNFSGPLPQDWSVWKNLTVLDLSYNHFDGSIPSSISNLTYLTYFNLENNSLWGEIPDLILPQLLQLNVANNHLTGPVPPSLKRFPSSAFLGNNVSFDSDAVPPALPLQPPTAQPKKENKKLTGSALLGIVIGACVVGFTASAVLMICCCSNRTSSADGPNAGATEKKQRKVSSKKKGGAALEKPDKEEKQLVFFEGCNYAFDLEDLLTASAEVLGKGTHGTAYKAALTDTTTVVVVKRLKEVAAGRKEFEQQMEMIGRIRHENVVPLRAYYCSKDEKLLVYDYYSPGSVSSLLHGGRGGEGRAPLEWETRLKIAIGTARGLDLIHKQNGGKLVHGNLKASNVFLNSKGHGCISDVALAPVMNQVPPQLVRITGYRAPEVTDSRKPTQASDVYSLGVILLELLTGKSPVHATGSDEVVHLVRWVHSVVREEWTAEVFDVELLRYPNIEEEMVEMLQIGMACVVRVPEQRLKISDVVGMVEGIRRMGSTDPPTSEIKSEHSSSTATPVAAEAASSSALQAQIASAVIIQPQVGSSAASQSQAGLPSATTHVCMDIVLVQPWSLLKEALQLRVKFLLDIAPALVTVHLQNAIATSLSRTNRLVDASDHTVSVNPQEPDDGLDSKANLNFLVERCLILQYLHHSTISFLPLKVSCDNGQKISLGRKSQGRGSYSRLSGGDIGPEPPKQSTKRELGKLMFPQDCGYKFEIEDMLRASAEVLGRGSFGTSYKGNLEDGPTIAVKRLKMANTATTEFEKLTEKISSIRHENVATLRAYYCDKHERLLVYDYYDRGSMSSLLHGKEGKVVAPMTWDNRLKMAIGAGRGIVHIHRQEGGKLFHGNLKPSNILVNSQGYGIVSDVLFPSLMNHVERQPTTKYEAPEVAVNGRSQQSDVYSFGVLLLELLVRKFEPAPSNGELRDFVQWGKGVSREVDNGEIFDIPLRDQPSILKELQEAFHLGILCVQKLPEERPKMVHVVFLLEEFLH
ncbi:probable inactive receptor kinase At4g23740 [Punica granatum]|uniref:Probable inactive receptor kinase At4g23740 n=1 Tax=Punica granatum TaxID=22663 RepID=A0A6P8CC42_PUNGR|nr:probable inactive receptor kinase At4g23740 [Punica granatum]